MIEAARLPVPAAWNIVANPILRRYIASQLRPRELAIWVVLMVSLAAWVTLSIYLGSAGRQQLDEVSAARIAFAPLLVMQSFILLFQGTSAVASGMVRESIDGMLTYQRLTPLSPLTKVIGYLFGLPARSWVVFFCTLPFTVWLIIAGQVSVEIWTPVYGVLVSTAVLYHMTGLMLGLVVPQGPAATKMATFLSYVLVALYLLLPNLGRFGLLLFQYLTVRPVFLHKAYELDPTLLEGFTERTDLGAHIGAVPFFAFEVSETVYTFLIQGLLAGVFLMVMLRRWRDEGANPLGKIWAVLFGIGIQLLLLGNALPLVFSGTFFRGKMRLGLVAEFLSPGQNTLERARQLDLESPLARAYLVAVVYGLVSLVMSAILAYTTISSRERMQSGLRRALHSGRRRVAFGSDEAHAGWVVFCLGMATSAAWYYFCQTLFSVPLVQSLVEMTGGSIGTLWLVWMQPMVVLAILWLLLETTTKRVWGLFALLVWMLPTMLGTLMLIWKGHEAAWALKLVTISPIGQVFGVLLPSLGPVMNVWWGRDLALWAQIWVAVHAALVAWLILLRIRQGRARRARIEAEGGWS